MSEWKQDHGVLRHGDERYKRQIGRVIMLIVERENPHGGQWIARTVDANRARIQLTRKFPSKEEAMAAIEKKAKELLQDALEDIARYNAFKYAAPPSPTN